MYFFWRDSYAIVVMLITSSFSYSQRQLTESWNMKPGHRHVCESACWA